MAKKPSVSSVDNYKENFVEALAETGCILDEFTISADTISTFFTTSGFNSVGFSCSGIFCGFCASICINDKHNNLKETIKHVDKTAKEAEEAANAAAVALAAKARSEAENGQKEIDERTAQYERAAQEMRLLD